MEKEGTSRFEGRDQRLLRDGRGIAENIMTVKKGEKGMAEIFLDHTYRQTSLPNRNGRSLPLHCQTRGGTLIP